MDRPLTSSGGGGASRRDGLRSVEPATSERDAEQLLLAAARGDQAAFAALYDRCGGLVYGIVRRVVRDPAQSEEVAQEVFVEAWRTATRFDPAKGSAQTWLLTMAHRRAIDRVRSEQASRDRTERVGHRDRQRPFDEVAEEVEVRLEHAQVRDALSTLTALQREAVELAYYGGHTYREVAELLDTPLGTIKTRMRDGFIRLRDALGVSA
jgi:RNA polymerase sigma-70 factor, ECF subfamily